MKLITTSIKIPVKVALGLLSLANSLDGDIVSWPTPSILSARNRALRRCWLLLTMYSLLPGSCLSLTAEEPATVPVRIGEVVTRRVSAGKVFIGTVEPARRSLVGSAVSGRVEQVFVEDGDLVDPAADESGKLVQLRLNTARIELAAAQADLEVARQQLAELVKGPREEELQRFAAGAKGAEAVREFARKKFDRLNKLFQRDATAKGSLDEALSAKVAAEQSYLAAKAEHEAALRGTREEQLAQAKARVTRAEEDVNRLEDQLGMHTMHAPFRGYVVKRFAEKGEWIQLGDPIAEIVELDPVEVRAAVPEEFISRVRQGVKVRVDVSSIAAERTSVLTGTVFRIVPSADARSRSFPVRIRIENPSEDGAPLLKPGMLAKVVLPVGPSQDALLVPNAALVLEPDQAAVFAVSPQHHPASVVKIDVEVGVVQGLMIEVRPRGAKLLPGMSVITEGHERLQSGQAVTVLDVRSKSLSKNQ